MAACGDFFYGVCFSCSCITLQHMSVTWNLLFVFFRPTASSLNFSSPRISRGTDSSTAHFLFAVCFTHGLLLYFLFTITHEHRRIHKHAHKRIWTQTHLLIYWKNDRRLLRNHYFFHASPCSALTRVAGDSVLSRNNTCNYSIFQSHCGSSPKSFSIMLQWILH